MRSMYLDVNTGVFMPFRSIAASQSPRQKGYLPQTGLFLILACLTLSCGTTEPNQAIPDHERYTYERFQPLKPTGQPNSLLATPWTAKSELFFPTKFLPLSEHMLIHDVKAETMLQLFSLDGQHICSWGRQGQGPEEFASIAQLLRGYEPGSFWVWDMNARHIKLFALSDVLAGRYAPRKDLTLESAHGFPARISRVLDDHFLASGPFSLGRLVRYSQIDGQFQGLIGSIPVSDPGLHPRAHSAAFDGFSAFDERANVILLATMFGSLIERYDLNGQPLDTLIGPHHFFPDYRVVVDPQGVDHMVRNPSMREGYLDLDYHAESATFYALYSGEEWQKNRYTVNGRTILVLDSSGQIKEHLRSERDFFEIEVADNGTLYALADEGIFVLERQP